MGNSLSTKAAAYTDRLDEMVRQGTLTSDLNINSELLGELSGNGEIKIAKMTMSGLADHVRGGGFNKGDLNLVWETMKLEYDRDREFDIDSMDDEERLSVVTANAMGLFAREKVIPEVDAIRFAKLAAKATDEGTATPATYSTPEDAYDAVLLAEEFVQDNGSALQDCVFYCSAGMKTLLRKAAQDSFYLRPGESPNTNFQAFDEMRIVTVPGVRFYTAIDLHDGVTAGEEDGGYAKHVADSGTKGDVAGKDINFMIVNPNVGEAVVKHNPLRYFAPDENQTDDAHKWQYRIYHDLLLYDNKATGIYLSHKA